MTHYRAKTANKLSEQDKQKIGELYQAGQSMPKIAAQFGINNKTVHYHLKKLQVPRRSISEAKREYQLNQTAFDHSTPDALYWAGFIMADGTILRHSDRSDKLSVSVAKSDAAHMDKLKAFLGYDGPTYDVVQAGPHGGESERVNLVISSQGIVTALRSYGMTSLKETRYPSSTANASIDYWRGVIDADGSVGWVNSHYPYCCLVGYEEVLNYFRVFLAENQIEPPQALLRRTTVSGYKFYQLNMYKAKAVKLVELLYANQPLALERKAKRAAAIYSKVKPKGWHSAEEAAEMFGKSKDTLYSWFRVNKPDASQRFYVPPTYHLLTCFRESDLKAYRQAAR